jgi:hypothetical protein
VNNFAQSLNGSSAITDVAGSVPISATLVIGAGGFSLPLNGHIRQIAYYPRRLQNQELVALTS